MSELTHLSSSGGEVLERPPGPLFFLCLLDLLGDLHGSFEGLRGINGTEGERERVVFRSEVEEVEKVQD